MKRVIVLIIVFIAIKLSAQKVYPDKINSSNKFAINASITGLKDGTWVYLIHNLEDGGVDTISRKQAKSETFSFSGKLLLEGEPYFIKIDTLQTKVKGHIKIIMESSNIELHGSITDLSIHAIHVSGSISHILYVDFQKITSNELAKINKLLSQISELRHKKKTEDIPLLQKNYNKQIESYNKIKLDWLYSHPDALITPFFIQSNIDDILKLETAYEGLTERAKKSYFGEMLRKYIVIQKTTSIGTVAPIFNLPTSDGKVLSLKDVVSKGKVTIIDFWASWCKPCRAEFSTMKELYEEYHKRGLNILGYSTDDDAKAWQSALEKDKLPWYNVRQPENDNIARKLYGVTMLPTTFLLDSNGVIVAKNLRGEQLKTKIVDLLK